MLILRIGESLHKRRFAYFGHLFFELEEILVSDNPVDLLF